MNEVVLSSGNLLPYPSSRVVHPDDAVSFAEPAPVIDFSFYALAGYSITIEQKQALQTRIGEYEQKIRDERSQRGLPITPVHERVLSDYALKRATEELFGRSVSRYSFI